MKGKKIITVLLVVCLLSVALSVSAFATVTDSSGDGFALYNGVKLSVIPQVYSYNVIGNMGGNVVLFSSTAPVSFIGNEFQFSAGTTVSIYNFISLQFAREALGNPTLTAQDILEQYNIVVDSWHFQAENIVEDSYDITNSNPIWSDYDVLSSDNNVRLAASSPIPLDGMNVIEWDGNVEGLASPMDSYYVVAPYSNATDAFAVSVQSNGVRSVVSGFGVDQSGWYVASGSSMPLVYGDDEVGIVLPKFYSGSDFLYTSLVAYRPVESPPDEGGGDDDDPQPPCGG